MWNCSLLAMSLALATGCAKFDLRKNIPWGEGRDGAIEQPLRVETSWIDTIHTKPNEKPVRGFGGRLYFFGPNNSQEPVKVEGTLVVYAFDETNRDPTNVVPDRKIVYSSKDFKELHSKTKLGHSYSVWVPWGETGGPRTKISLIARFIPTKGAAITSEQLSVVLPGTEPLVDVQQVRAHQTADPRQAAGVVPAGGAMPINGMAQQAAYQQPVANRLESSGIIESSANARQLSSYTIPLRGSQAQHFMQRAGGTGAAGNEAIKNPAAGLPQADVPSALPALESGAQARPLLPHAALPGDPTRSAITPVQPRGRFGLSRPQAQGGLAAPPQFLRDQMLQRLSGPPSNLASQPSPGTPPGPHGSAPAAGPSTSPPTTHFAAAYQNRP
jgi:hypothetical protein